MNMLKQRTQRQKERERERIKDSVMPVTLACCHLKGQMSSFPLSHVRRRQEPDPASLLSLKKEIFYPSGRMCFFLSISVSS